MNPRQFLIIGGIVLVLLSLVGFAGVLTPETTPFFWLDNGENIAHLVLGVVALAAVYLPGLNRVLAPLYRPIVILVGLLALFFAVYGFVVADSPVPNTFGVANLENPSDNLLHLVVGVWALAAALRPLAAERKEPYPAP